MTDVTPTKGSCLCGKVQWRVTGPLRAVVACHCTQCRKTSGHFAAFSSTPHEAIDIDGRDNITWYRSSESATRGFCATCGSVLFWQPEGEARVAVAAGSIDGASGLVTARHIYVADKGDYYDIADGVPQIDGH